MSKYKALKELINNTDGQLSAILLQLKHIEQLNAQFKQLLSQPSWQQILPIKHYQIIKQDHHCLIIAADSAAYATKLRYQSTNLLSQWRQQFDPSLQRIELTIQPIEYQQAANPISSSLEISPENITLLEKLASHTKNPALRKSLQSLIKSAKNHQPSVK